MKYDIYDLYRFVITILLKSILEKDYSNRMYIMFEELISKDQADIIENNFKDNKLISDESNVTIDQVNNIDSEIYKGNLFYPQLINHTNTTKFLKDSHRLFNWEKYESKLSIGKENNLSYYAVILNRWMRGESISQIINENIKYNKDRGTIYNTKSCKEEKFVAIGLATGNEPQLYPCPHPNEIKSKVAIKLWFDSNLDAKHFLAGWLDGGGEQVCGFYTKHGESDDWTKGLPKWLKLVRSEEEK